MKIEATRVFFTTLALATLVMGCGNTVKGVCEDLDNQCPLVTQADCTSDGNSLEATAKTKGCEDAFDTYLDCVASAGCSFRDSCATERAALEKCTGPFPQ